MGKVLLSLIGFCFLAGCQIGQPKNAVKVFVNEDGKFPSFLVGRWVSNNEDWEFTFDEEGVITSAMISMGRVTIIPGQTTTVPMRMGGKGVYEPGEWTVTYTPSNHQLAVEVEMKQIRAEMGTHILEGSSRDIFVGVVSEEKNEWIADWVSIPHYTAFVPEPHELPVDPEDNAAEIVFKKAK
ncbi:MAG: hypothetical protein JXB18_14770 [Sedimentisphaerales bacterium]|nr:hypothetical protein [Sedimentisphaerales bacterium]